MKHLATLFLVLSSVSRPSLADTSEKFRVLRSAAIDEGPYCTAAGWEFTEQQAMDLARHRAKELCVLQGNWAAFDELDMTCTPDCTEFDGTVTDCVGWFQCRD